MMETFFIRPLALNCGVCLELWSQSIRTRPPLVVVLSLLYFDLPVCSFYEGKGDSENRNLKSQLASIV